MKYVILIHNGPAIVELFEAMSDEEKAAAFQVYWDVEADLNESGELVDSKALDTDAQKIVVRGRNGKPVLTEAAPPSIADSVSGYYLVDVAGEARAAEIAARFPEAVVPGGIRVARVWTDADFAANA